MVNFKADQMLPFKIRDPDKSSVAASNVYGNYLAALKFTNLNFLRELFQPMILYFLGNFQSQNICIEARKG